MFLPLFYKNICILPSRLRLFCFILSFLILSRGLLSVSYAQTYALQRAIEQVVLKHPQAQAKRFEIKAQSYGLTAAQKQYSPALNFKADLLDDLVTLPNPASMTRELLPIDTQRYRFEFSYAHPLQWGTLLTVGLNQSLIETANPFRSCVPGIPSERCFETQLLVQIQQPLLRGSSAETNLIETKISQQGLKAKVAEAHQQISLLLEETIRTYATLVLAQAQIELEQQELGVLGQKLKEAQARLDAGQIAQSDLYPLQVNYAQRQKGLVEAQASAQDAQVNLEALTREPIQGQVALPSLIATSSTLTSSNPLWDELPDLVALFALRQQTESRIVSLRDQDRSQLDLSVMLSQSGLGEEFQTALSTLPENNNRYYGVSLTWRWILFNQASDLVLQTQNQVQALKAEYENQKQRLQAQWKNVQNQEKTLQQSLKWGKKAVDAATLNWKAVEERYRQGRATAFEVAEIQNQVRLTRFALLQSQHQYYLNQISALRLKGELVDTFGIQVNLPPLRSSSLSKSN